MCGINVAAARVSSKHSSPAGQRKHSSSMAVRGSNEAGKLSDETLHERGRRVASKLPHDVECSLPSNDGHLITAICWAGLSELKIIGEALEACKAFTMKAHRNMLLVDCDNESDLFFSKPSSSLFCSSFRLLRLSMDVALPMIRARNFCVCEWSFWEATAASSLAFCRSSLRYILLPKMRSRTFPLGPS